MSAFSDYRDPCDAVATVGYLLVSEAVQRHFTLVVHPSLTPAEISNP